jgi:hypothetical protein
MLQLRNSAKIYVISASEAESTHTAANMMSKHQGLSPVCRICWQLRITTRKKSRLAKINTLIRRLCPQLLHERTRLQHTPESLAFVTIAVAQGQQASQDARSSASCSTSSAVASLNEAFFSTLLGTSAFSRAYFANVAIVFTPRDMHISASKAKTRTQPQEEATRVDIVFSTLLGTSAFSRAYFANVATFQTLRECAHRR